LRNPAELEEVLERRAVCRSHTLMRARLIVNPVAGHDSAPDHLEKINVALRNRYGDLDIVMTAGLGDAERAAAIAGSAGYDIVFVAGGDGTLNEVLNGLARLGALSDVTVGLLPLGTGNDFATALGLPTDIDEALAIAAAGRVARIDVGRLNDRVFANVSAGGFIAEVSDAVSTELKGVAGRFAYLLGGAQVLLSYEPVRARIVAARESALPRRLHDWFDMQLFAVCNAPLIGGGRPIAPFARPDDGLFDVCIVDALPTLQFLGLLRGLAAGAHVDHDHVTYFRTSAVDLEFDRTILVNTDGQVLETRTCVYRILPGALGAIVP
jgi:diacylglycerol kinase (ATP)